MAHKPVSYPADYRNDPTLRRGHRGGLAIVWTLLVLILISAVLITVLGTSRRNAIRKAVEEGIPFGTFEPFYPHSTQIPDPMTEKENAKDELSDPTSVPEPTKAPVLDPNFMDHAAEPFAEAFKGLPDVIEAVAPGVVGVINWQPFENGKSNKLVEWGSGSGFVVTTDGYILTNQHVIEGAKKISVKLYSGDEHEATLIGADKTSDIAVLKIDAEGLTALPKGDSDKLRVGEFVFAVGDPVQSELSGSVTFGIISAKARSINIDGFTNSYLQTDAAINLGNSGGPLIDLNGCVVGMNSAKSVTAGYDAAGQAIAAEGIGFALPINRVWEIASQLISTGAVPRPGIGITITQYIADYAAPDTELRPYVNSVTPGGPADLGGMKENDVILAVDGIAMADKDEIVEYIREHTAIGQEITFTVLRGDQELDLKIVVGDLNRMP